MEKASKTRDMREALLQELLRDAPFDGWRPATLEAAAQRLGADAQALFPRGMKDAALHFSRWADARMLERMAQADLAGMRVRDRVALGVRARLEILAPHRAALPAAMAFLAPPSRHLLLPRMVWETADAIWRAAGDTATDYNYYTKRLLLSGVLASTTLFWLDDGSKGHARTWEFLDRRIENVLRAGKALSGLRRKRAS